MRMLRLPLAALIPALPLALWHTPQAAPQAVRGAELAGIVRRVAGNEMKLRLARDNYTYRQTFEFNDGAGVYLAVTDVTFTPEGKRIEKPVRRPVDTLRRIKLTEEDFRDLVQVQPFVLDPEDLWNYEVTYMAEQAVAGLPALMLRVRPRQVLATQRLFDGVIWVSKDSLQVLQTEGKAVPNIYRKGQENLFPHFTTIRARVTGPDGTEHWFPSLTYADDVLPFKTGPQRVRFTIRFEEYKRFSADSSVTYQR